MKLETVKHNDIDEIRTLQPDGWTDIVPEFEFYLKSPFCYPIKATINNEIVGVGTSIIFGETSWIAHIIVNKTHRSKGIGYIIVDKLLRDIKNQKVDTCQLIATEVGLPLYLKFGFRIVTKYEFFKRDKPWTDKPFSKKIVPFKDCYGRRILELDKEITGENREILLTKFLDSTLVYIEQEKVIGYYIPDLKDGLIYADTVKAGLELMNIKYSKIDKAILPSDNLDGIEFLKQNGFVESDTKGTRMILGNDIDWKPKKMFSRIGGNFG